MTLRSNKNPVLVPAVASAPDLISQGQSESPHASENPHTGIADLDASLTAEHSSIELLEQSSSASPDIRDLAI